MEPKYVIGEGLALRLANTRPKFTYQEERRIASGNLGVFVYFAKRNDDGQAVAVKKVPFDISNGNWNGTQEEIIEHVEKFVATMKLKHPNIIEHYGLDLKVMEDIGQAEVSITMEYCDGITLHTWSNTSPKPETEAIKLIAHQIATGMVYLYKQGIVHLDLKGRNIMVTKAGQTVKICDFADMAVLQSASRTRTSDVRCDVGTTRYMAPEMFGNVAPGILEDTKRGRAADVYSFGCVLIEMLTGKVPQYKNNNIYLETNQAIGHYVASLNGGPEIPETSSKGMSSLLKRCLERDPSLRPTAKEISQHPGLMSSKLTVRPKTAQKGVSSGMEHYVIGIDLGTSKSCVAVYRRGNAEVIQNQFGNTVTPSYVTFEVDRTLVGEESRDQSFSNPENTIFGIKRIIGRPFNAPDVQEQILNWPFTVVNKDNVPHVQVDIDGNRETYSPIDISAIILRHMRDIATRFLDCEGTQLQAVITVPASFTNAQREATIRAGAQAGLKVIGIIIVPAAALLAYKTDDEEDGQKLLVFDFGGATLDITIMEVVSRTQYKVLASSSNMNLGGEDFSLALLRWFIQVFNETHPGLDKQNRATEVARIRLRCEAVKKSLSSNCNGVAYLNMLDTVPGHNFSPRITLQEFNDLCENLFARILQTVKDALQLAQLNGHDIDHVVLVGGSSLMPKVKEILQNRFPAAKIRKDVGSNTAVAEGAAIFASLLQKNPEIRVADPGADEVEEISA